MREILFRGKRKDNGEWIEGSLVYYRNIISIIVHDERYYDSYGELPSFQVIPSTVGQYTGLTDKNGVKIFEGDIVSFTDCWDTQHKGVVHWWSGSYDVDCSKFDNEEYKDSVRLFTAYACGAEIIGNIHDNTELMEVNKND